MSILNDEKSDNFISKPTKYSDDDEESSVASTLSDYNGIFYGDNLIHYVFFASLELIVYFCFCLDACSINSELIEEDLKLSQKAYFSDTNSNNNKDHHKKDSMNSSFESSRLEEDDEDINNFEDSENKSDVYNEMAEQTKINEDVYSEDARPSKQQDNDEFDDEQIRKEFEEYLNDEEATLADTNTSDFKQLKLRRLENLEFNEKNLHLLRQMAIEKFGFVNKKFRRKAWPLLLLDTCFVGQENVHSIESFDKICKWEFILLFPEILLKMNECF